jgi:Tfp pilus assembly protein PilO
MNVTKNKQQISVYIVAGMLITDFIFFGYLPSHQRIKSLSRASAQQAQIISNAAAQQTALPEMRKKLQQYLDMTENFEAVIPAQRKLGEFLQQIDNIIRENELTNQIVAPEAEIKAEDVSCIPIAIECKGSLLHIFKFFQSLQQLDRLVRVEHVKLENDKSFNGIVKMNTRIVIFYRIQTQTN